jgi:4-hydroxy-3-methylbut-2-enyl diphosphate reductase
LNMNIHLAEHYGVCFGVRDALQLAETLASQGPLTILGELVHNPVVRERLAARGVREAAQDAPVGTVGGSVMITAHGASDRLREHWKATGLTLEDGTCPLVRNAHEQLRQLVTSGHFPVVIGKRGHVEVRGLTGDFPEAYVLECAEEIPALPEAAKYGVVSQTTQQVDRVRVLVAALRAAYPDREFVFRDTVCQPTKNRQLALTKLLSECDTLVVVGGRNSNNTLELVKAGEAAGKAVVHVTRAEELDATEFEKARDVGVTAGTSTLKETVAAVVARLRDFAAA